MADNKWYKKQDELLVNQPAAYDEGALGEQVRQMADNIVNRKPFSYDFAKDPAYQQYQDQYVRQGKQALQEATGNAAMLTGGYGNSYGATAGNQAYQEYLSKINAVIPQLYDAAMNRYQTDLANQRADYAMLQAAEQQAYGRHQDAQQNWLQQLSLYGDMGNQDRAYDRGVLESDREYDLRAALQAHNIKIDNENLALARELQAHNIKINNENLALARELQAHNIKIDNENLELQKKNLNSAGGGPSGGGNTTIKTESVKIPSDVQKKMNALENREINMSSEEFGKMIQRWYNDGAGIINEVTANYLVNAYAEFCSDAKPLTAADALLELQRITGKIK